MSEPTYLIFAALGGALLATLLCWLWMSSRSAGLRARLEERDQALARDRGALETERVQRIQAERDLAEERASSAARQQHAEEQVALLREAQDQWLKEIAAMSRKALDSNSKSFVELARTQFEALVTKADERGEQRKVGLEKLLQPFDTSLKQVQEHLKQVEKQRTEAYVALTEQVKGLSTAQAQLQKEASNLVSALRKPSVRGRWGEVQLRRVVEMVGMVEYCDFEEQVSVQSDDGRLRPDLTVRLPGGRIIVVDAKAPLEAYLDAVEAEDDDLRQAGMTRHVAQVRDHVKKLGQKAYFDQFDTTPDMVVMFLPGESFFYAALQEDPSMIEYGVSNNVVIATPMTLIALLRAVAYGWRQEQVAENARQISSLGQQLYDRIVSLAENFSRVGSGLNTAVTNYNKTIGSLESRVLVSARRFKELGSGSSKDLPELPPVEDGLRALSASDLLLGDTDPED